METDFSLVMAARLKRLREEKGLSLEKLSKAMYEKYGVEISTDSLINYEVSDPDHKRAYKNNGMRVEYLRYFADFYGVSADYLLGADVPKSPSITMQEIIRATGIAENSLAVLCGAQACASAEVISEAGDTLTDTHRLFLDLVCGDRECCPRMAGHDFISLINDLLAAAIVEEGAMIEHATLVDASEFISDLDEEFDEDNLTSQLSRGFVPIPAAEYVRYGANEVGKIIGHYLAERYGYGNH